MSAVQIVAIVNSFNRFELLRTALPSLAGALARCSRAAALIVYDAGSTDGSLDWIAEFARGCPIPIDLLEPERGADSSFAGGINAASRRAIEKHRGCSWFFFFETDNWIAGPAPIMHAIALLESRPELAAAGFTVRKHSGERCGYGCPFPTPGQFVLGQQLTHLLRLDAPAPRRMISQSEPLRCWLCDVVFTSPLLVRRAAWKQSGGFDAVAFPFSDSDLDWAWRARKLGWEMAVIETDEVVHDNREQASRWSATRALHFHRSRMKLLRRHAGAGLALLKPLLFLRHGIEWVMLALAVLVRRRPMAALGRRWQLLKGVFRDYDIASQP